jgi:hypothetical protein
MRLLNSLLLIKFQKISNKQNLKEIAVFSVRVKRDLSSPIVSLDCSLLALFIYTPPYPNKIIP